MTTCKEEALRWVHRYAAGGAAFAAIPLPFSTTAALAGLETHMISVISNIYGEPVTVFNAATANGTFHVVGQGLKYAATQATLLVPLFGIPIRMAIAGATIEGLGRGIVMHLERKHPGKMFTAKGAEVAPGAAPAPAVSSAQPTA